MCKITTQCIYTCYGIPFAYMLALVQRLLYCATVLYWTGVVCNPSTIIPTAVHSAATYTSLKVKKYEHQLKNCGNLRKNHVSNWKWMKRRIDIYLKCYSPPQKKDKQGSVISMFFSQRTYNTVTFAWVVNWTSAFLTSLMSCSDIRTYSSKIICAYAYQNVTKSIAVSLFIQ